MPVNPVVKSVSFNCPTCKSVGFEPSVLGPSRCSFCDGTEGGNPPHTLIEPDWETLKALEGKRIRRVIQTGTFMPPLVVYRNIYKAETWIIVAGARTDFEELQQARDYASQHGYSGIKVEYL